MKAYSKLILLGSLYLSTGFLTPTRNGIARSNSCLSLKEKDATVMSNGQDTDRRNFLRSISAAIAAGSGAGAGALPLPAFANEDDGLFTLYQDESVGFQIKRPSGWEQSEQSLPDRRRIVLFVNNKDAVSSEADKDLMFVAYTPVRDDFTQLSSFGSVEQVGQMTILPKGELAGADAESKMLSAESKKNSYYFDYIQKTPGQPKRHFRTIFSLVQGATGGAGSVLVTITVQTSDEKYKDLEKTFDEIISSYEKLKK